MDLWCDAAGLLLTLLFDNEERALKVLAIGMMCQLGGGGYWRKVRREKISSPAYFLLFIAAFPALRCQVSGRTQLPGKMIRFHVIRKRWGRGAGVDAIGEIHMGDVA